jgi:hypothetical protein
MHFVSPVKPRRDGSTHVNKEGAFEFVNAHSKTLLIPEPGAPNLDATEPDALMTFWLATSYHDRTVARFLFPERPTGYVRATGALGAYAANKATAMGCRERGDIRGAECYESICEGIYERLPEYARW